LLETEYLLLSIRHLCQARYPSNEKA
jgi:hypothetical protein